MDQPTLYHRIADQIRQDILEGRLQPGGRLPAIRELTAAWNCTPGTVQRAYQELAQQGLVVSQAGKGTHVAGRIDPHLLQSYGPLRRAGLVHRAEAFLLEVLTSGFEPAEIQQALDLAMDRWRSIQQQPPGPEQHTLRFSGSHDIAMTWLASHFDQICSGCALELNFSGSLGGLMALAEGRADLSGSHLFDPESGTYNLPYIRKLFPGRQMALVRLAERSIGLALSPGNPLGVRGLRDLARSGVRFVNRQGGSGTRVWLDQELERLGIDPQHIHGYADEKNTHSEVARAVAEGKADAGLALESAAAAFNLDFQFLVQESYDLVFPAEEAQREPLSALVGWLGSPQAKQVIGELPGYDAGQSGKIQLV
jgi:molybdate-binding protein/DNA-binding transcriptional regulator YhcF (GntR family)